MTRRDGAARATTLAIPGRWAERALCAQADPDAWFPYKGQRDLAEIATRICGHCPVRAQCMQHALSGADTWGGIAAGSGAAPHHKNATSSGNSARRWRHDQHAQAQKKAMRESGAASPPPVRERTARAHLGHSPQTTRQSRAAPHPSGHDTGSAASGRGATAHRRRTPQAAAPDPRPGGRVMTAPGGHGWIGRKERIARAAPGMAVEHPRSAHPQDRPREEERADPMSRLVAVPDWGDSGSLCQWITVPEPGDDGYPMAELSEGDPWAPAVNRAITEIETENTPPGIRVASRPEYLGWEPDPEAGS